MISSSKLDAYSAAFTVLGRLHLQPADAKTRAHVYALVDDWPIDADKLSYTEQGITLLKQSCEQAETDSFITHDQDKLYGISAQAKVPPYESVHRGRDGLVFDKQTLEVRCEYAKLSLQAPHYNVEPDDHIGLELDFLARCCLLANEGDNSAYELALIFTREHILSWAPAMLLKAFSQAESLWLRALLALTIGAIESWCVDIGLSSSNG